eukprot:TRINITY_DN1408_c0_g1_i1.p1 TRINITY_DN1408_c0_g1~~TRINITY_DN1408_c0_g1_i1.p1  ORF type:complete len:273 (+),score=123.35 TRINITY_DN1408_c0_g1_i1:85-903(+)
MEKINPHNGNSNGFGLILQIVNVALFVLTIFTGALNINGNSIASVSAKYPTLITPADYAFAIWGVIYLVLLFFTIWQLLPRNRQIVSQVFGLVLAAAYISQIAWTFLWLNELMVGSMIALFLIWVSLLCIYFRINRAINEGLISPFIRIAFSLWLGWINLANLINITIGFNYGLEIEQASTVTWALAIATIGSIFANILTITQYDPIIAAVTIWGLIGIFNADYCELTNAAALVCSAYAAVSAISRLITYRTYSFFYIPIYNSNQSKETQIV